MLTLIGCSDQPNNGSNNTNSKTNSNISSNTKQVVLPYSAKDVLNPYTAETKQNQELSKLLFDSLFVLDESFSVINRLAKSYEFESNKCTVKLKNAKFTDNTPVTSDDVIYSFLKARSGIYASQLSSVTSCVAIDSQTVVFSQNRNDPNLVNLLDFPIIKLNTDDLKDENSRSIPPIGCGRYTFSKKDEILIANQSYYNGKIKLSQIKLIDCPDDESLKQHIITGKISTVYSDLSSGSIPKKQGAPIKISQSNLVFLGINSNRQSLNNAKLRLAISSAIDREQICDKGFYGYADEATDIFPSIWARLKGYESLNKNQNSKQTVAYLNEIGYNRKDVDDFFTDRNGKTLSLTLLCNSQNSTHSICAELISSQLNKCGIEVNIKSLPWAEYILALQTNDFDMYVGEVKFGKSLYVYKALNPSVIYGFPAESDSKLKFEEYYNGNSDIMVAISSFATELPFIPVCYKNGVTISSEWLEEYVQANLSDVYYGIENYN